MGALLSASETRDASILSRVPAPLRSGGAEINFVRSEIDASLAEIASCGQDVNIVFTGPICIGVAQYCETFATLLTRGKFCFVDATALAARSADGSSSYVKRIERLDEIRKRAATNFCRGDKKRALVLHTCDLQREIYTYQMLAAVEAEDAARGPTPSQPLGGPKFRVFYQNPDDHAIAMARASRELGYLDEEELSSLEIHGESAWNEAAKLLHPSKTLYVYVQYETDRYAAAYSAYLESLRKHREPDTVEILEKLEPHAKLSKSYLDALYSTQKNDIVSKYFSISLKFDDRTLLAPLQAAVACREVLSFVSSLQKGNKWACTDVDRVRYVATSDWLVRRVLSIPRDLVSSKPLGKNEAERDFREGAPPLPRAVRPSIHARVQELRSEVKTPLPEAASKPAYGSGKLRAVVLRDTTPT